jgi:hypothetical protein
VARTTNAPTSQTSTLGDVVVVPHEVLDLDAAVLTDAKMVVGVAYVALQEGRLEGLIFAGALAQHLVGRHRARAERAFREACRQAVEAKP